MTQFVIAGAGSIGCYIGGLLHLVGERVVFLARGARAADLAEKGLKITDLTGFSGLIAAKDIIVRRTVPEAVETAGDDPFVIVTVKGSDTAALAGELGQTLPPGCSVLSFQNGVDNPARIFNAAPHLAALTGMVSYNVVFSHDSDGVPHVHRATSGDLMAEDDPATRRVKAAFDKAGLSLGLVKEMVSVQWGKLLLNLNNPVNTLSGLPLVEQLSDRDYRRVLAALQAEALGIMGKSGVKPAKVGSAPPWVIPHVLRLPDGPFRAVAGAMLSMDPAARSSMLDDVNAGRKTEIDDLTGAVVRLARDHGLTAPKCSMIQALVEKAQPGVRMSGKELRSALGV